MHTIIIEDTRQQNKKHDLKHKWFEEHDVQLVRSKCLVGDYMIPSDGSVSCDSKASLTELYSNLISDHERFHNECVLAMNCGIRLYIVVENKEGFTKARDIEKWKNPQMFRYWKLRMKLERLGKKPPKPPVSNVQLIKIMSSMTRDYGVQFVFCRPEDSAQIILDLLTGSKNDHP